VRAGVADAACERHGRRIGVYGSDRYGRRWAPAAANITGGAPDGCKPHIGRAREKENVTIG
jgi:hypothetical protein